MTVVTDEKRDIVCAHAESQDLWNLLSSELEPRTHVQELRCYVHTFICFGIFCTYTLLLMQRLRHEIRYHATKITR